MRAFRALRAADSVIRTLAASKIMAQAKWLAAAKIVQGVASVSATIIVARDLGPADFGRLALASAIALFLGNLSTLGLEHIATRELSTVESARRPLLSALRRMRSIGALTGCMVLLGLSALPNTHDYGIATALLILCLLPLAQIGDLAEWRLLAAGRSRSIAITTLLSSPLAALARMAMALEGAGIATFAWLLVAEWALRSLLLSLSAKEKADDDSKSEAPLIADMLSLLRESAPLLMAGIAIFIYMRIDQFMIALMLDPRDVGLYSSMVALAEIPLALPVLLLRAALPTLARQSASQPGLRDRTLVKLMRNGFYLHLLVAVVISALAPSIVSLFYGEQFLPAVPALRIQVLGAPFVALGVLSGAWIVLNQYTQYALWRTALGAVVNTVLNLFLIPSFGIAGAASATVVAFIATAFASDAILERTRPLLYLKLRALDLRRTKDPDDE